MLNKLLGAEQMDVEMKVADMSSSHSEKKIKETLFEMEGVQHIETHLEPKIVKITYDQEQVSLEQICDTIDRLGYSVDR